MKIKYKIYKITLTGFLSLGIYSAYNIYNKLKGVDSPVIIESLSTITDPNIQTNTDIDEKMVQIDDEMIIERALEIEKMIILYDMIEDLNLNFSNNEVANINTNDFSYDTVLKLYDSVKKNNDNNDKQKLFAYNIKLHDYLINEGNEYISDYGYLLGKTTALDAFDISIDDYDNYYFSRSDDYSKMYLNNLPKSDEVVNYEVSDSNMKVIIDSNQYNIVTCDIETMRSSINLYTSFMEENNTIKK